MLRRPLFVNGKVSVSETLGEALPDDIKAVIFDTSVFKYDDILDWMYKRALEGKRYTMGLYSSQTGKLITQFETL